MNSFPLLFFIALFMILTFPLFGGPFTLLMVDLNKNKVVYQKDPERLLLKNLPLFSAMVPLWAEGFALDFNGIPDTASFICERGRGKSEFKGQCWYFSGHGKVTGPQALVHSCRDWALEALWRVKNPMGVFTLLVERNLNTVPFQRERSLGNFLVESAAFRPIDLFYYYNTLFNGGFLFETPDLKTLSQGRFKGFLPQRADIKSWIIKGMEDFMDKGPGQDFKNYFHRKCFGTLGSFEIQGTPSTLAYIFLKPYAILFIQPEGEGEKVCESVGFFLHHRLGIR